MAANHVVIAGATGYLGRHLVKSLRTDSNIKVTALVRPGNDKRLQDKHHSTSYTELDVTDERAVGDLLSSIKPTHVINASSYGVNPSESDFEHSVAVNTWGTYALLAGAARAGARRFTQVGSYFEYAPHDGEIPEGAPVSPESAYAATKAAASLLINDRRVCGDMETVVARAFHLWGSQEPSHRLPSQIIAACQNRKPLELTSGLQKKDFTYVSDAAKWINALTLHKVSLPHSTYNIAGGKRCSVREFVTSLAAECDGADLMRFGIKPLPKREPPSGLANTSRLESLLGPLAPTPFRKAIEQTLSVNEFL